MPTCRKELIKALGAKEQAKCFDNKTIAKEQGKEFKIQNRSKKTICRVQVDGCLIKARDTKKCDFLFKICETEHYILVELKGSDVTSAFPQIVSTLDYLKDKLGTTSQQVEGFIVSSRVPKAASERIRQLKKQSLAKHGLQISIKNRRGTIEV